MLYQLNTRCRESELEGRIGILIFDFCNGVRWSVQSLVRIENACKVNTVPSAAVSPPTYFLAIGG